MGLVPGCGRPGKCNPGCPAPQEEAVCAGTPGRYLTSEGPKRRGEGSGCACRCCSDLVNGLSDRLEAFLAPGVVGEKRLESEDCLVVSHATIADRPVPAVAGAVSVGVAGSNVDLGAVVSGYGRTGFGLAVPRADTRTSSIPKSWIPQPGQGVAPARGPAGGPEFSVRAARADPGCSRRWRQGWSAQWRRDGAAPSRDARAHWPRHSGTR